MDAVLAQLQSWPKKDWVRVVIVQNHLGQLSGLTNDSNSLTNPIDRKFYLAIRNSADLVITGANSIRAENPPAPQGIIWIPTKSGKLSLEAKVFQKGNAWLLSTKRSTNLPTILLAEISPHTIMSEAQTRELNSVVIDGGINLIKQFLNAKLVDEAIITIVDKPGVGEALHRSNFGLNLCRQIKMGNVMFQQWLKQE